MVAAERDGSAARGKDYCVSVCADRVEALGGADVVMTRPLQAENETSILESDSRGGRS